MNLLLNRSTNYTTKEINLKNDTLVADGVRAADSPMRRVAISSHGPISYKQLKYHPVWDWRKKDLLECFNKHKVKLIKLVTHSRLNVYIFMHG